MYNIRTKRQNQMPDLRIFLRYYSIIVVCTLTYILMAPETHVVRLAVRISVVYYSIAPILTYYYGDIDIESRDDKRKYSQIFV